MVDFNKRLSHASTKSITDPVALYETLDRASDKGPLRPAQITVLNAWNQSFRDEKDVILKLHTGQGKTLIGLLILQAKLNENVGPSLYLCPNNFLIKQTCIQAKQFGIKVCSTDGELPEEFLDGKVILVTSIQKLFNGLTKFHLGQASIQVSTLLMDDSHACIDSIRDAFSIKFKREHTAYQQFLDLFSSSLELQGAGTLSDIRNNNSDALLPIPYWEWRAKQHEIVNILSKHVKTNEVKFAWPLLKDTLQHCQCVISGAALEITPYLPPLELFGTYDRALHRIFMSATVTDDSFLVKGLRLSHKTIQKPLVNTNERWSGEKMILIPSLIDESLDRSTLVNYLAKPAKRHYGIVALVPGFKSTIDWAANGSTVATKETIESEVEKLRNGNYDKPLVIANRYDGIDLPDDVCRILILDSKPYSDSLVDLYEQSCRASSEITAIRAARKIEQGLGRSVRGEKDYCVIVVLGAELVRSIRSRESKKHLSHQTQTQVEIGLEIAEMAKEEIAETQKPLVALSRLIEQSLKRDVGWKAFYVEKMEKVTPTQASDKALAIFEMELTAEMAHQNGDCKTAVNTIQSLIDTRKIDEADNGWYLQEIARYLDANSKVEADKIQLSAHKKNRYVLKPRIGIVIDKLVVSQRRVENIIEWVKDQKTSEGLQIALEDIFSKVSFGAKADKFEDGINELGKALGFSCERPDKEWKEGPDNLWGIRDGEYLVIECKSEVHADRKEIFKEETGQMNNSIGWFKRNYQGATSHNIMIIPTPKVSAGAAFADKVVIIRVRELSKLKSNVHSFFNEFKAFDFKTLSEERVQQWLDGHELSIEALLKNYTVESRLF